MKCTREIYNETLIIVGCLCLEITNKFFKQLEMSSPNRSAIASFNVESGHEQNYNMDDLLFYVQSNIFKLTFEQKSNCNQIMQSVNTGFGVIFRVHLDN